MVRVMREEEWPKDKSAYGVPRREGAESGPGPNSAPPNTLVRGRRKGSKTSSDDDQVLVHIRVLLLLKVDSTEDVTCLVDTFAVGKTVLNCF